MRNLRITLSVLFAVITFFLVTIARAHNGEPRLEISAERLVPGTSLEVRGVNFEPEEEIQLNLVGPEIELSLGGVTADAEGVFLSVISLPTDLAEGAYTVRANTDDHEIFSPQLIISGMVFSGPEVEGDRRDEEDGLLAPMPTFPPASITTAYPAFTQPASTPVPTLVSRSKTPTDTVSSLTRTVVVVIVFFILIAVVIIERG